MTNKMVQYVDPVKMLGGLLLSVDKPARYTGGEVGRLAVNKVQITGIDDQLIQNNRRDILRTLIAFPDLYEIGMGNLALKIIYNYMNSIPGIICDRAFAPAPDFEKLLREKNIPLYGLDTGINLAGVDLLMFTLGYELGFNGILTMLDVSGIPLRSEKRNLQDNSCNYPIIIAGGPAVSNPFPYSQFIDAFWIGEAEAGFFDLANELSELKKRGQGRAILLEKIISHPNIWAYGKEKASRAIYSGFSESENKGIFTSKSARENLPIPSLVYPVPSMKIVQNHGTVEIMRGCPNGCRFCHAGFWYRPARQKNSDLIASQVNDLVTRGGWQQISLSSLSSGDYIGIDQLIENLNKQFSGKHVSFQLPSLKVSSFTLSLLEKISVTRKSGLTFAVETPRDAWQMAINKEVTRDSVVAIINEAKRRGWKGAKFYFMIGLGTENNDQSRNNSEEEEIVAFIADVARKTRMHFNINVGIFIPKPHTPFQWSVQLDSETALKKLNYIRFNLKPLGHKVSISDSLISRIEGLMSRGDERAGLLCEEAWQGGSRLDAWDEFINKEKWIEILDKNFDYVDFIFSGKSGNMPQSKIDSCVNYEYLKHEFEKSAKEQLTPSCRERCGHCGVCKDSVKMSQTGAKDETLSQKDINQYDKSVNHENNKVNESGKHPGDPVVYRVLFSFTKTGSAVFHGHLSLIEIFSMAFRRADIPVKYTEGFNPLAKLEFASPLSTGVSAECEYAIADFNEPIDADFLKAGLNANLPEGIQIKHAEQFVIKPGEKKHSLTSLLWGFAYASADGIDYVNCGNHKAYKSQRLEIDCKTPFDLLRKEVLARNIIDDAFEYKSYFEVYRHLYG